MTDPANSAATRDHLHYALLRLAGRIPDEALVHCRELLAAGELSPLAQVVSFTATQYKVPMDARDVDLMRVFVDDLSADAARLDQIPISDGDLMPPYAFEDASSLDKKADGVDQKLSDAVRAKAEELRVVGAWKSVRSPAGGAIWPPPQAVWSVEVDDPADAVDVYREFLAVLTGAGTTPLLEVFHTGTRLPSYQDVARLRGTLLWASSTVDPRLAAVYDFAEDGVPGFHDDHPRIEQPERDLLVNYLRSGEPLLLTTALLPDVLADEQPETVPVSFRTDGDWIWSDAIGYYLDEHGVAPEADLLTHLRARAGSQPAPTGVQLHRALAVLDPGNPGDPPRPVDASTPGDKPTTESGPATDQSANRAARRKKK